MATCHITISVWPSGLSPSLFLLRYTSRFVFRKQVFHSHVSDRTFARQTHEKVLGDIVEARESENGLGAVRSSPREGGSRATRAAEDTCSLSLAAEDAC
jgi:hypothetical protein